MEERKIMKKAVLAMANHPDDRISNLHDLCRNESPFSAIPVGTIWIP